MMRPSLCYSFETLAMAQFSPTIPKGTMGRIVSLYRAPRIHRIESSCYNDPKPLVRYAFKRWIAGTLNGTLKPEINPELARIDPR